MVVEGADGGWHVNGELVGRIMELVEGGAYPAVAAQACGVTAGQYECWVRWGSDERYEGEFAQVYREFAAAMAGAEARAECESVGRIRAAGGHGQWQADAWYLERKHKGRWARAEVLDVQSRGQGLFDVLCRLDSQAAMVSGSAVAGELAEVVGVADVEDVADVEVMGEGI